MPTYNRKDDLSSAFNSFWQEALNSKEDYYSKLTLKEFVHLKKAITNINNIITMLVTESFVKTLHSQTNQERTQCCGIYTKDETAKGYRIFHLY